MHRECLSCSLNTVGDTLSPAERVYRDDAWRVAHGWSSLPGWLVVVSQRHLVSLAELTRDEATRLGELVRAASLALHEVVGCEKTYVMQFAEAEGFAHVHVHVVPRMAWFTDEDVGPRCFRFMNVPEAEQVPVAERERLGRELGTAIRSRLD